MVNIWVIYRTRFYVMCESSRSSWKEENDNMGMYERYFTYEMLPDLDADVALKIDVATQRFCSYLSSPAAFRGILKVSRVGKI